MDLTKEESLDFAEEDDDDDDDDDDVKTGIHERIFSARHAQSHCYLSLQPIDLFETELLGSYNLYFYQRFLR